MEKVKNSVFKIGKNNKKNKRKKVKKNLKNFEKTVDFIFSMWYYIQAVANETATHIDKLIESKKSETTKTNFYKVNFEQLVRYVLSEIKLS